MRKKVMLLALGGILACTAIVLLLRLPQRIQRGERGQEAIEMLDAMRRPLLEIKAEEARLTHPVDAETARRRLATAIDAAESMLHRYAALARYNPTLSTSVGTLEGIFRDWVLKERRLFECVAAGPTMTLGAPPGAAPVCDLTPAATRFLDTMSELGAGEGPIHADIAEGRNAFRVLQASVALLLLYLIGLLFWAERRRSGRENALLQERLRLEAATAALEKSLGEALARALSGFIPICASCKRVRGEKKQWAPVEAYITSKTAAQFSHTICPGCREQLYGHLRHPKSG